MSPLPTQPIRVIIADDQPLIRDSIRTLLEPEADITIVAEAEDGLEAIELVTRHQPDLILLDIGMPLANGFEVATAVKSSPVKVLIVTMHLRASFIRQAIKHEVEGYLAKSALNELVQAIRAVNSGETYFSVADQANV